MQVSEFNISCRRWRVGGKLQAPFRSMVNASGLQLLCARVLHEGLLVPVLLYGSEATVRRENDRSRIRAVQIDNLRGMQGIKRMERIPNARIESYVK